MKRRTGVAAVGVAVLLASLFSGGAGMANAVEQPRVAARAHIDDGSAATPPARAGKWLVDAQGRVIVEHGWNIAQKEGSFWPDFLTEEDARFLANQGFTTARISFIWKGAEPAPGQYDEEYLKHVLGVNHMLAKYGISVLYDFHHNAWNVRGGAPDWATLGTDTGSSFQAFWEDRPAADGVGIQTRFINLWKHIAKLVNEDPDRGNIVGFNPFNEPSPGTDTGCPAFGGACPGWEQGQLFDFYEKMIAAVRSTGNEHVIWPEGPPSSGIPHSMPLFEDEQVGYNFHFYCTVGFAAGWGNRYLTPAEQAECERQKNVQLVYGFLASADQRNEPAFMSEFGCGDDPTDNARVVDAAGRAFASWASWEYHLDGSNTGPCPGLLIDPKGGATMSNVKPPRLEATSVPYAHEIAGTPESYDFDRATKTMTLTYGTASVVTGKSFAKNKDAPTRIFVPAVQYPNGYKVAVTGGQILSKRTSAWVEIVAKNNAEHVTVTITPKAGSRTDLAYPEAR
ncbi:cellulase family glycosylhydrolase [Microbacterium sp. NPDC056044]|uniref:cellulase family glycosylhydrolase n=1 Tax=Microbacterium sp. NPDC056044 TaxID=3345690 RepID=UPI0035DCD3FF